MRLPGDIFNPILAKMDNNIVFGCALADDIKVSWAYCYLRALRVTMSQRGL